MKKANLAIFAVLFPMVLASCATDGGVLSFDDQYSDEKVLTDEIIKANAKDNKSYVSFERKYTGEAISNTLTVDSSDFSKGYAIVHNSADKYGIFSYFGNKFLVEPQFTTQNFATVNSSAMFGAWFNVSVSGTDDSPEGYTTIFDGMGNDLYNGGYTENTFSLTYQDINNKTYSTLTNNSSGEKYFHSYDDAGRATKISALPNDSDKEYKYAYGDNYAEKVDLSVFEPDNEQAKKYYVKIDKSYYVYNNSDDSLFYTYTVDDNAGNTSFAVGGKVYVQRSVAVASDSNDYTYAQLNIMTEKFRLDTFVIDLIRGEVKTTRTNKVYTNVEILKDKDGNERFAVVEYTEINADRTLGAKKKMVLAADGKYHEDVTGKTAGGLLKLNNGNFYDSTNNVLYDSNFKQLAKTNNLTWQADKELFYNNETNKFGIVDATGKVKMPFKYTRNDEGILNTVYVVKKDGKYVAYDIANGTENELPEYGATDFSKVDSNRLLVKTDSKIVDATTTYSMRLVSIDGKFDRTYNSTGTNIVVHDFAQSYGHRNFYRIVERSVKEGTSTTTQYSLVTSNKFDVNTYTA